MTFTDTDTTGISELLVAVRNNSFGDFKVDPDSVTVVITGKWVTKRPVRGAGKS
jgi:archaellum component FlaG (FlaF/FlaG flagellin family)